MSMSNYGTDTLHSDTAEAQAGMDYVLACRLHVPVPTIMCYARMGPTSIQTNHGWTSNRGQELHFVLSRWQTP